MSRLSGSAARRHMRHRRIRRRVVGFPQRPRLSVFRSHKHLYVQLVDDVSGKTLLGRSTRDARLKSAHGQAGKTPAASALGTLVAEEAKARGIARVVFDRGGYLYHGRVKALAEAVRQGGVDV